MSCERTDEKTCSVCGKKPYDKSPCKNCSRIAHRVAQRHRRAAAKVSVILPDMDKLASASESQIWEATKKKILWLLTDPNTPLHILIQAAKLGALFKEGGGEDEELAGFLEAVKEEQAS